jgi:2-dehydropantoate 2-reductase
LNVAVIGGGAVGTVLAAAAATPPIVCVRTPIPSLVLIGPWPSAPSSSPEGPSSAERPSSSGRPVEVAARLVSSAAAIDGPVDLVFVTVKATESSSVRHWLSALCGPSTVVVAVQNGLDHASRFTGVSGSVVPGLAYLAAERLGPGRVRHLSGRQLVVPESVAPVVADGVPAMSVRGETDMLSACWKKLLVNLVANPITALTMQRVGVMSSPGIADLARGVLAEAVEVGRAEGAEVSTADIEPIVAGATRWGPETGSSMLYDRQAGRPMEHQHLTGEVVRRGAAAGIPTPLNSALLALLEAVDIHPV